MKYFVITDLRLSLNDAEVQFYRKQLSGQNFNIKRFSDPTPSRIFRDIRTAGMAIILRIVSSGTTGFSYAYCVPFLSVCAKMNALSLSLSLSLSKKRKKRI